MEGNRFGVWCDYEFLGPTAKSFGMSIDNAGDEKTLQEIVLKAPFTLCPQSGLKLV